MPRSQRNRRLIVLYEDNHCLAVSKPAGLLTTGDKTHDESLLDIARRYVKQKYDKPGNVFLGVVHRLDRPVSGVVLFARTSKAAARLSHQFRTGSVRKRYRACVEGTPPQPSGTLVDHLVKDRRRNMVEASSESQRLAKRAALEYRLIRAAREPYAGRSWPTRRRPGFVRLQTPTHTCSVLEITPQTGRSHQIRVQLANYGLPIIGDVKYGARGTWSGRIALHAAELEFEHPVRHERMRVRAPLPVGWDEVEPRS